MLERDTFFFADLESQFREIELGNVAELCRVVANGLNNSRQVAYAHRHHGEIKTLGLVDASDNDRLTKAHEIAWAVFWHEKGAVTELAFLGDKDYSWQAMARQMHLLINKERGIDQEYEHSHNAPRKNYRTDLMVMDIELGDKQNSQYLRDRASLMEIASSYHDPENHHIDLISPPKMVRGLRQRIARTGLGITTHEIREVPVPKRDEAVATQPRNPINGLHLLLRLRRRR